MNRNVNNWELPLEDKRGGSEPKAELGLILVVEDDSQMQKVLKRIFTRENYSIEVAEDGKTDLELFRSRRPQGVLLESDSSRKSPEESSADR